MTQGIFVGLMLLPVLPIQAVDAPPGALALLQGLPHLVSLDLSSSKLEDKQLAGLEGLTGLGALNLTDNLDLTFEGMQALLPTLQLLTSLELLGVDLGRQGFQVLAQLQGLHCLVLGPDDEVYDGIEVLTRLQHLTMLGAPEWEVLCYEEDWEEEEGWRLLRCSSLRALHVKGISDEGACPLVSQVTELQVEQLFRHAPLLTGLVKLAVTGGGEIDMPSLMQHSAITELVLAGGCDVGAHEVGQLALLPHLRVLTLELDINESYELSDAVLLSTLGQCTGLERLALSSLCLLTDQGLEVLASGLPSLRSLKVWACIKLTVEGRERVLRLVAQRSAARGA